MPQERRSFYFGDPPNGLFGLVRRAFGVAIPRADGIEITVHRAGIAFTKVAESVNGKAILFSVQYVD
jgi:hypothetical protein